MTTDKQRQRQRRKLLRRLGLRKPNRMAQRAKQRRQQRIALAIRRRDERQIAAARFADGDVTAFNTVGVLVTDPKQVAVLSVLDELGARVSAKAIVSRISTSADIRPLFPYEQYRSDHVHRTLNKLEWLGVVTTTGRDDQRMVERRLSGIIEQLTPRA